VIAVGANPVTPSHLPIDGTHIFDSNTIFQIKKIPRSLVVLGGGIIGCEYASMFSTAGTHVSIVDKRHEILASVDREIVNHLVERMSSQGLEILLECEATKVEKKTNGVAVHLSSGRIIQADAVLVALGRHGNTKNMGLSGAGIEADPRGLIKVGPHFQTSQPNVYAVGDVIGFPALAATSMEQGRLASCDAFGIESTVMSPHFPAGIYTIPEISTIGKSEEELLADGMDVVAGRARYRELARGQIVGDHWGLLKMLVDRKTLKIHGVHIIGDSAADLIHIGQAVMSFGGDVTYFIRNVFNYPTLAEAYKTAAFHAINQIRGVTTTR
ncbi:MAG: FAD-dependent oxidoreductase, partial [Bdellovibrionota bacterium]